ncbi:hypothetical protein HDF16_002803 [Granulicella aggregans]|uniref:Nucleotidyltransferase AbiEii toxin of type IV toxin-antitoxin system n=1 Tax=Granulicella aggregans TaxID=474949 RepID=A0A7W8E3Z6_9BACT|nr:nucleotidyl transferase AbiEii/AbiGii toxin family protein [Granulicella aggregans]MBB5058097.1 hypothetical protein [Granulicella aggregans]
MPQPVERLEKTLARVAKEQGVAQERLRRWVTFLALCGVLERAVSEGILDSYDLKGGVALELRFAEGARATKDIDIGVPAERTKRLRAFQDAVALSFDDFTFRLKGKPLNIDKVDAVRLELAIRYRTRAWQTIDVDLGPSGRGAVEFVVPTIQGLAAMGLRVPSPIRCLNLSEQIAQKLHACTGPYSAGRARDVLDILLIDMLGKLDAKKVQAAAEQVFKERATHGFPPTVQLAAEWKPELEVLAKELGYSTTSATEIESRFSVFVDLLAKA